VAKITTFLLIFTIGFAFSACSQSNKQEQQQTAQTPSDTLGKAPVVSNGKFKALVLKRVIESKVQFPKDSNWFYEPAINSPKSAIYSQDGSKFYINSLEGYTTAVFDAKTLEKTKEIRHEFTAANNHLFKNNETATGIRMQNRPRQSLLSIPKPIK